MLFDFLLKKHACPCKVASVEELDECPCKVASVEELDECVDDICYCYGLSSLDPSHLKDFVCKVSPEKIIWEKLGHIRVIGNADEGSTERLEEAGIDRGFYLNADGTWLLWFLSGECSPEDYLNSCNESAQSLWLINSLVQSYDAGKLPSLRELRLAGNSQLETIVGLGALAELKKLTIFDTPVLRDLPGLEQLTQLTELTLFSCAGLTTLPGLEKLTKLTDLDLRFCKLTTIPGLEKLTQLTELNLSHSSNLTALPGLEKLTQLAKLRLFGCDQLTALPGVEKLTQLTKLDLSFCHSLTGLPALEESANLTELNLSYCRNLTVLPDGIRNLKNLRWLKLCNLHLQELPDWLPEIAELFFTDNEYHSPGSTRAVVDLSGTTVVGVDMSLFDMPYEMVVRWFESRAAARSRIAVEEAEPAQPECEEISYEEADCTEIECEETHEEICALNEIKVVFLGDGEAGKSHTIARLLNDGNDPENFDGQATPGIAITDRIYDLENRQVQVHFWDFGGQEILHSMHRMFLTKQTLYVVLLNARDDKQDEQARYWLHNIKSFTTDSNETGNQGAKVLLVVNKIDQNPNASLNETGLRLLYPSMTGVVRMSALKASQKEFNEAFTAALLRQISGFEVIKSPFTSEWQQLKEKLRHMPQHYIKSEEFAGFCQECGVEESETVRKTLLEQFKNLGACFCYSESQKLEDYVVLQPHWITNAIYILLYNKIPGNKNGMIPHADIYRMLKEPDALSDTTHRVLKDMYYSSDEVQYVLNVIRHFRLSYPVDSETEFFPMLCDRNETSIVAEYAGKPDVLEFKIIYEYLPNNVLHRLMVDMHRELQADHVWLTGAHFLQAHSKLSAVVKSDGNILTIYVRRGKEYPAKVYLDTIKDHLERISREMGLEIRERQIVYYEDNRSDTFDYDELVGSLDNGIPNLYSKKMKKAIPIKDILQQSGHQASEDREKLIQDILLNCRRMQTNRIYWKASEDDRNTYIRDALENRGYTAKDQTLVGVGAGGKRAGELDIEIRKVPSAPWTIFEGLNLRGTSSSEVENWNEHLKKLLDNYNPIGLPFLIMTSYIPCKKDSFPNICATFINQSKTYSPDTYLLRKSEEMNTASDYAEETNYLRMVKCLYDCGGAMTTAYHIFVRLGDE